MIDIAELRELLQAATPRPWCLDEGVVVCSETTPDEVCDCSFNARLTGTTLETARADAALIAAAVNALPELLAVYEAACAYADAERTERRYSATQYHALLAAVDAARKAGT